MLQEKTWNYKTQPRIAYIIKLIIFINIWRPSVLTTKTQLGKSTAASNQAHFFYGSLKG